jgi:hypothetical protein
VERGEVGEFRPGEPHHHSPINSGRESVVSEFTTTIHQRLSDAYDSLRTARDTGDDLLMEAQRAEIDDLCRTAANHGVDLPRRV